MKRHSLELCREGEKEAPRQGGGGVGGSIGTLSCSTLVYTEQNWRAEVSGGGTYGDCSRRIIHHQGLISC